MLCEVFKAGSLADCVALLADRFDLVPQYSGLVEHRVEADHRDGAGFNSKSAAFIDFHNDAYDYPVVPEAIALYCHSSASSGGETFFSDFDAAFDGLDADDRQRLSQSECRYFTKPAEFFGRSDLGVRATIRHDGMLRYSYGYLRDRIEDPATAASLARLNERLHGGKKELRIEPGEALVLCNRTAVHGRNAFVGARALSRFWLRSKP